MFQPREIFRVLNAHGVKYVVIGNLAGTLHGSPLSTVDVDICPSRDEANLAALAAALTEMSARIAWPFQHSAYSCKRSGNGTARLV